MKKKEMIKKWKLIYALIFQLFVYLFSEIFEFDNILIIIAINVILYIIPFYITIYQIRVYKTDNFKSICIIDLINYLIPAVFICPVYESLAVIITKQSNESNGVFSIIMIIIYILIYLFYVLLYKLNINKNKKHRH